MLRERGEKEAGRILRPAVCLPRDPSVFFVPSIFNVSGHLRVLRFLLRAAWRIRLRLQGRGRGVDGRRDSKKERKG